MKNGVLAATANVATMFLLAAISAAHSAELNVISAVGMQSIMEELKSKFELATGHKLAMSYETLGWLSSRRSSAPAQRDR
jgi:ABC-type molybdate transport system substrate-binding protein